MCGSLSGNQLCGIDMSGNGTYTAEGINKLCESIKTSSITSLRCAAAVPAVLPEFSVPADVHLSCTCPVACGSLKNNRLGPEGGAVLAEGLNGNTTLTSLK